MPTLQSDDPNDRWAEKYADGRPHAALTTDNRRRAINELVEREIIGTAKDLHRRMRELFGDQNVAGYDTIRNDVLHLKLILMQAKAGEWRFRQPGAAFPADLMRELQERLRVDAFSVTRVAELVLRIDTNPGIATSVAELLKEMSRVNTSRPGLMMVLTDNYDTVAIWTATERHADEWHEYLNRQLL